MKIAKISLFSQIRKLFDYYIPENFISRLIVGVRVLVSFGTTTQVGFVVEVNDYTNIPSSKLKPIIEIIDLKPIIPKNLYDVLLWAVKYYQSSIGAMLDCALPRYYKENKVPTDRTKKNNALSNTTLSSIDPENIILNNKQKIIVNSLLEQINKFHVSLIEGVTGSGKTEIYLQLTKEILKKGKQTLILVPEIGLTPQTLQRFTKRFYDVEIAIIHSNMTSKQRYINWVKAKDGIAKIVLGTRSAGFVPLLNPGLFIIDEEHDPSFKQQNYVKYMARDFLIMRAKFENCPIILGSATPSLETLYNVRLNKYSHYKLPNRAVSSLPKIDIIDIRHKKLTSGLSSVAIKEIQAYLDQEYQVLLFINRRGYAPLIKCFNCQWVKKCINCDSNMILHIYTDQLQCHHCQKSEAIPTICPICKSVNLVPLGQGTEKIEELFKKVFPLANIARIDKDSMSKKHNFLETIAAILNKKINLLIGTQMIAKGHHFPNLGLVVIVDIDNALFGSDFRATEKLGQLIIQVAGRAGREKIGRVLLQTSYPTNPLIKAISEYNYDKFTGILFQERQAANLPPYSYQVLWRAQGGNINSCLEFLHKVKNLAAKYLAKVGDSNKSFKALGPISALIEKKKKKFHARLLFQDKNRIKLQGINSLIIDYLSDNKSMYSVEWCVDVDPKEIF
jgi:primosomal protein N' (replication factor Y) (superfamily II helicase)